MKTVAIHDAKTNLSKYIAAAKRGEIIYIGNHSKPEVKLIVTKPADITQPKRKLGPLSGKAASLPDLEDIDKSPQWQKIIKLMLNDPLSHD